MKSKELQAVQDYIADQQERREYNRRLEAKRLRILALHVQALAQREATR